MDNKEIKSLIEKRELHKKALHRIKEAVDNFEINSGNINQLKSRLSVLKSIFTDFDNTQNQLELADTSATNKKKHAKEREDFENKYYNVETDILTFIDKHNANLSASTAPSSEAKCSVQPISNVRLPQLNLPEFEGNYTNWTSFHDSFHALIHESNLYSNVEKFHYLRSCLKGDAYKAIESVTVSDTNYQIAWDVLKKRYENSRLIIQEHVFAILNSPSIQKGSHSSMRQLVDDITINIAGLKSLNQPVNYWDAILIPIIVLKFDFQTRKDWESILTSDVPTLDCITKFIEKKCLILESLNASNKQQNSNQGKVNQPTTSKLVSHNQSSKPRVTNNCLVTNNIKFQCPLCKNNHLLFKCEQFLKLSTIDRVKKVDELKLCPNCFRNNHNLANCKSSTCRVCNMKHNTLLHKTESVESKTDSTVVAHIQNVYNTNSQVLLCTAQCLVKNSKGDWIKCRALLDVGSQSNFVTQSLCNQLNLSLLNVNIPINGVNESTSIANHIANIEFKSINTNNKYNIKCLVLPRITNNLPSLSFTTKQLNIPTNLPLADPNFNKCNQIDILLGAGIFWSLLRAGQIPETQHNPHFQETTLGWIIGGNINSEYLNKSTSCYLNTLEQQLLKFWEIEESPTPKNQQYSQEELDCIEHFKQTHKRNDEGRFIVRLPFRNTVNNLGESKHIALNRLNYLEKKLSRDPESKLNYDTFMREYEDLNHMQLSQGDNSDITRLYLPHHAVTKELSTTTKVRVVFDASAKTSTGLSLNDSLMIGPKLQDDLFAILVRFRTYQYVLSADINKMYRQILVAEEDQPYQSIVWRYNQVETVSTYQLNTVTYGTACAPFIAVQCLQQLAEDEKQNFPIASQILANDFYMDDLLTGTNYFDSALKLRFELQSLLLRGGFELRKWTSNEPSLLPSVNERGNSSHMVNLEKDGNTKLLGLGWNYRNDELNYVVNHMVQPDVIHTKRSILSNIAKIFDPLGLLSPIIIKAKLIIQNLWQIKQEWDEPLPKSSKEAWLEIINQINDISNIKIPRKIIEFYPIMSIELHGFSDASEKAYGACIYIRTISISGEISINLICAKSRVAPLKVQTIPRLELCGALLLSKLMKVTIESLKLDINHIIYWTDSTIVLAWLATPPNTLKTFVATRVAQIQSLTNINSWNHVKTADNPADLITRGSLPKNLIDNVFWFHGPDWLQTNQNDGWSPMTNQINVDIIPEQRTHVHASVVADYNWLYKYSDFVKLQRVTAYCLRFIEYGRTKDNRVKGELTASEIQNATTCILKIVQKSAFDSELNELKLNREINNNSKLKTLNPFLDSDGLIRVGGRLRNADITYNKKYPVVLPKHHVTDLIIKHTHKNQLHAGQASTLTAIREKYWPLAGRSQVRKVLRKCIACFRVKPQEIKPTMGDLPASRCEYQYPFLNCGVDYAGPILIKEGRGRGKRKLKSYICVFICFATKAMHLELVGDLTADSFLNALKRFISRRGLIKNIHSDNATNFVGAEKELNSLSELFISKQFKDKIINKLAIDNITWHFIPARSPSFGGLWEAGVKQVKYHLKRVIGNALLTFEELCTLLASIEACLNSRPLLPLSDDPNDLTALTPGHFLIGRPLKATPEPLLLDTQQNRLSRWQFVEQLRQHFWKRWVNEYLSELQTRPRTKQTDRVNIQRGALVVLKEINAPPLAWKYGRITELHPGSDGVTRVVSVQTHHGITKRAVRSICVVPVDLPSTIS